MIHVGNCLDVLRLMEADSVDAIVTDPPYGLSFMGKKWDYDVPSTEIWAECLRVLKPGGHLLAFAGTRTQHRMAVRIDDAGFEIRDMIAWVYGSGFPKSLDVSKEMDKANGNPVAWREFSRAYAAAVAGSTFTHSDIDRALGIKSSSCYWARNDHRGGMPPRHHWDKVRELLKLDEALERLYAEAERADRLVTAAAGNAVFSPTQRVLNAGTPQTEAARQWEGWGTALKPALEPITMARKPLEGTVAANVLAHGTGALNIGACRIETVEQLGGGACSQGRWPANLIHDGSEEVLKAFPNAPGQLANASTNHAARKTQNVYGAMRRGRGDEASADSTNAGAVGFKMRPGMRRLDGGSAARFFYCAKASKRDRDEGLESLARQAAGMVSNTSGQHMTRRDEGYEVAPRANHHPTVKPTDLMRYLCRLVTPAGGLVLDPFAGSGSTGKAAVLEGFRFLGIEVDEGYAAIAEARIAAAVSAKDEADAEPSQPGLPFGAAA